MDEIFCRWDGVSTIPKCSVRTQSVFPPWYGPFLFSEALLKIKLSLKSPDRKVILVQCSVTVMVLILDFAEFLQPASSRKCCVISILPAVTITVHC